MTYLLEPRTYVKAIVGSLLAGIAALVAQLEALPENSTLGDITTLGWVIIVGAVLVAFNGVFWPSNRDLSHER